MLQVKSYKLKSYNVVVHFSVKFDFFKLKLLQVYFIYEMSSPPKIR